MNKKTIYWIVGIILFFYFSKCSKINLNGRSTGCSSAYPPNVCKPIIPLLKCSGGNIEEIG